MLYCVVQSCVATEAMELTVERGHIVGVIKKHNPLGDTRMWFVDDGCKICLILYTGNILCVCVCVCVCVCSTCVCIYIYMVEYMSQGTYVSFSLGYCFIT